jgi:N-acetylmuramoyl-L-alanine amidase
MKIVISSGHGKLIRGASGYLDEVDEARKVVNRVAEMLAGAGVKTEVFHDDVSTGQSENLERIVAFHNGEERDLDVSVHFNAYQTTTKPMGTECLFVSQEDLASEVAAAISHSGGFLNRGPKERDDLYFLNNTDEPAILIEVCFVDSTADAELYDRNFETICQAIASKISGVHIEDTPPAYTPPPSTGDVSIPVLTVTVDPPGSAKVVVKGGA